MAILKLFNSLANTKTRTMVIFASTLVIVGIVIAATQFGKAKTAQAGAAVTLPVPSNIKAVPGNKTPQQYQQLLHEDNKARAIDAKKNEASSIATLVGGENKSVLDTAFDQPATAAPSPQTETKPTLDIAKEPPGGYFGKSIFDNLPGGQAKNLQQKNSQSQDELLEQQKNRIAQIKAKQQEDENRARQDKQRGEDQKAYLSSIEKINKAMDDQTKAIFSKWAQVPPQTYVAGPVKTPDPNTVTATSASASSPGTPLPSTTAAAAASNVIKAGTILFAVLNTSVNSDEPGPVLATIVQGDYKDSTLIGSIQSSGNKASEKLTLNFNLMSRPNNKTTDTVSMVAIDPDTARTALASNVDHHYLLRYGSLFAASFMSGYGQAITNAGAIQTNNPGSNTTTTTSQILTPTQQLYAAAGAVGTAWATKSNVFDTPITISVNAGTGVGLLVLEDIHLQDSGS